MRKMTNATLTVLATTVVWLCLTDVGFTQALNIGYVNDNRIYDEYEPLRKAQEQWNLDRKAWDDEALEKQEELQELVAEYEKQKLILSEEKKREREATINTKREALDAFTKQVFGPEGTAERKYKQLMDPLIENIQKAIEGVAIEENYDVIFTLQGIGYIKEIYDVTDKVLKYLEEHEE
ncbi:MAG: OmpH family outer membrane protein [Candidatus Zixiibacteriota bacterium]